MAWAWVIICVVYFFMTFTTIYGQSVNLNLREYFVAIARPLVLTSPMVVIVSLASAPIAIAFSSTTTQLFLLIGLGMTSYFCMYYWSDREYVLYLYSLVKPLRLRTEA